MKGDSMRILTLFIALVLVQSAYAVEVIGKARVVDGDTLDIEGLRVRLHGIDAPEVSQTCHDSKGAEWACGVAARNRLADIADKKLVRCSSVEWDKYKRLIAKCMVGETDLQETLMNEGLAYAFTRYSHDYAWLEGEARKAKVGLWAGISEAPWDYRDKQWHTGTISANAPQKGCVIKGNISQKGDKIYHMPWSPWYGKVTMTETALAKGKRWFCNENEAMAAGFRPASMMR